MRKAHNKATNMVGMVFSRLVVLGLAGTDSHQKQKWLCRCECGNTVTPSTSDLTTGHSRSCGCSRKGNKASLSHGMSATPEYRSWRAMKARCYNEKFPAYEYWGGRGIKVCDKWIDSFQEFYADMGNRPQGTTLDRIDNNGDYTPNNCRWATLTEQSHNKRTPKKNKVGVKGVRFNAKDGVWISQITHNRKQRHLGRFASPLDAIAARRSAEIAMGICNA